MKIKAKKKGTFSLNSFSISLAISFLALALGIASGCIFANKADDATLSTLISSDVLALINGESGEYSLISTLFNLFKYPATLLFLAFSATGVFLTPCVVFSKGFFLSLSVSSVISAFGKNGFLLSLSMFGLQSLISIPIILLFSAVTFEFSKPFAQLVFLTASTNRGKQIKTGSLFFIFLIVLVFLLISSLLDAFITPKLVSLSLKNIF